MSKVHEAQRNRWLIPVGDEGHMELTRRADGTAWFSMVNVDGITEHDFTVILKRYEVDLLVLALTDMNEESPA